MMRFGAKVAVLLALLGTGLAGCGGSSNSSTSAGATGGSASNKKLTHWTLGIIAPHADAGFLYMAHAKGFDHEFGVDISIKPLQGGVQVLQALLSNSIDAAEGSPTGIIPAASQGATAKIVAATTVTKPNYAMFARSDIGSFADLKGKTVGVSAPGALPDLITRSMLAAKGLDPHSVKIANVGSDSQRMQALIAGRVSAVPDSIEYEPQVAKNSDIHVIGTSSELVPKYPQYVTMAGAKAMSDKADTLPGFIAAQIKGANYALAHPDEEKALTAKILGVSADDPALVEKYKIDKSSHAIMPDGAVPKEDLVWLQNLMLKYGFQEKKTDINALVDDTFRQQALKLLNGQQGG